MKTTLTPDQMRELQSLGLDCSDASMAWITTRVNDTRLALRPEASRLFDEHLLLKLECAYTLEDILMKLPPLIDGALLTIQKIDKKACLWQNKVTWGIAYMTCEYDSENTLSTHSTGARKVVLTNDLITGLVDMLKWVLQNHPDKIKRL